MFFTVTVVRQNMPILRWLLEVLTSEQPDALFIAGDVFDHANPPAATERMFYDFLIEATQQVEGLQVVVIAGNHDGAARWMRRPPCWGCTVCLCGE